MDNLFILRVIATMITTTWLEDDIEPRSRIMTDMCTYLVDRSMNEQGAVPVARNIVANSGLPATAQPAVLEKLMDSVRQIAEGRLNFPSFKNRPIATIAVHVAHDSVFSVAGSFDDEVVKKEEPVEIVIEREDYEDESE